MRALSLSDLLGRPLNHTEEKNAPKQLYVEGSLDIPLPTPRVSVVGTRKPTKEGMEEARVVTEMLVNEGVTVVSGLATGIDTVAHRTAIDSGGRTVAILGTPLDKAYPASNRYLQNEVATNHLAVSQFPPSRPIAKGNFVIRNRTMALISHASVIVEAGDSSGTLHQGWETLRLGRPLFVCRTAAKASYGWLKEMERYGAIMLEDHHDILYEIPHDIRMENVFVQSTT